MSSPAASDDVVKAARIFLAEKAEIRAVLGSSQAWDTWLFIDRLYVNMIGTQQVAAVLTPDGDWTQMNSYNTQLFPRLGVTFYADVERDPDTNDLVEDDTRDKILTAFKAFNKVLHRVSGETEYWGDLRVTGSRCLNQPYLRPWQDSDHAASAQVFYALTVG